MRVMVIVKATKGSESGKFPGPKVIEEMGKFNEELIKAGIRLSADGLRPSSDGKRIHFTGTRRTVIDGPFAETKELVSGFWLWQVRSMEEAMEWAKRCPSPYEDEYELEIRPLFEMEDLLRAKAGEKTS